MPYSRTTWINGSGPALNATNLNNLEAGVVAAAGKADNNVFTGTNQFGSYTAWNTTPTQRQPFNSQQVLTPGMSGSIDKIGHEIATVVSGDFTSDTGTNPTTAWGLNVFTSTGVAASDGAALNLQNLIETDVKAASGTLAAAIGLQAEAAFYGAASGATVTNMISLRVAAPSRKGGATAGTATNIYGCFIETASAIGGTVAFSLFVNGGVSRFGGRVDVTDNVANNGSQDLQIFSGFTNTDGAALRLFKSGGTGHARFTMATTSAEFQIHDNTSTNWSVSRTGLPKWNAAGNQQTTVGAAGGGSAPPATPVKYLKVVDSAGTTLVVPAYNP